MGQPDTEKRYHSKQLESKRSELKHLSSCRKRRQIVIPLVEAIEEGKAQTVNVEA